MMSEIFGLGIGTFPQWGMLVTLLGILGLVWRTRIAAQPAIDAVAQKREANLLEERAEDMTVMRVRLEAIEAKLEAKDKIIETKDRQIEAERAIYRHRTSNLSQAFHSLLMLLKKGVPIDEAVEEIEELRRQQLDREIAEAATYRASGLQVADPTEASPPTPAANAVRDAKRTVVSTEAALDEELRHKGEET